MGKFSLFNSYYDDDLEIGEVYFSENTMRVIENSEKLLITYHLFRSFLEEYGAQKRYFKLYSLMAAIMHQWTDINPIHFFVHSNEKCIAGILYLIRHFIISAFKEIQHRGRASSFDSSQSPVYSHEEPECGWEEYIRQKMEARKPYKGESLETLLGDLNSQAQDIMSLMTSEFGRKVNTVISLLVCIPIVNKLGITPSFVGYEQEIERALRFDYAKYSKATLMATLVEHTTWVLLKITTLVNISKIHGVEAGIRSLFVSNKDFQEFEAEYMWLRRNKDNFSCRSLVVAPDGTPDPFTLEGYMHRCEKALNMAAKLMPALKHDPAARNRLERTRYDILTYQSACAAELRAGETRPFPYAMMLCGPPGIGKSTIKDNCFIQMHMSDNRTGRFEIKYNPSLVYTANPSDDFYSGFSTEHTSILLDDVAQKTPEIIKQSAGDDLADLIQIINKIPFLPNQAELEKKGKTPMRVRYVIGTTNTPDLSVGYVFNCPEAVYRRMVFVDIEVKPEYRIPGSVALQGDLINPDNIDLWNFKVYRYFPTGSRHPSKRYWNGSTFAACQDPPVLDLAGLMRFIDLDLDRHWQKEERAEHSYQRILKSQPCKHGISSAICKECEYVGETSIDEIRGAWPYYKQKLVGYYEFIFGYMLITLIYSTIFCGMLFSYVSQNKGDQPSWFYRRARSMIDYIPSSLSIPAPLQIFSVIPDSLTNYSLYNATDMAKTYLTEVYLKKVYPSGFSWSKYYQQDIARLWMIPGLALAIMALRYLVKANNYGFGQAAEMRYPEKDKEEKAKRNYWVKDVKLGQFPHAGSTVLDYHLKTQVTLNTVKLDIEYSDRVLHTNALMIKGNCLVTVSHWWRDDELPRMVRLTYLQKNGLTSKVNFLVSRSNVHIDSAHDLLYMKCPRLHPFRDLTKFLLSNKQGVHVNGPGVMIHYRDDQDYTVVENPMPRITNSIACPPYKYGDQYYDASTCYSGVVDTPTHGGHCGAPIIVIQGMNKAILGIHCASNGKGCTMSRAVYVEDVEEAFKILSCNPISDNDFDVCFSAETKAMEITFVHPKCPTHQLKDKELIVIGGNTLPRSSPRTKVGRSPIWQETLNFYRQFGYKRIEHVSPIDCDPRKAIMLAMEKAVENAQFYPEEIDFMVEQMSKEFISKFTPDMLARLHPYPLDVAINGVDDIPYIDRLNLKTSGGYGHTGPKLKLFELTNPDEHNAVKYKPIPELEKEVNWILEQYRNGREANPVFKCSFKDEPITIEKAEMSKVRIFSASPTAFSLVARMYLLCIIREFVGHRRLSFEMAIGANAHGMDWEEIYQRVVRHGTDRCFAGDYKNFDKQMPPELIMAAFEVIINILKAADWSEEDLLIVRGIATDTAFPTMDLFGTLIQCFGSNPSGHVLTTIINSLVNSLYIRIACKRILDEHNISADFSRFSEIVSLVTYGDDNCGSVSAKYPMITHTTIQDALGKAGIIYTTDDKKSASIGLTDVSNITFLKRRFVLSKDLQRMVAPLVEDSLYKSLTVWTYSSSISKQEQLAAVLESANREYFFYGKERFTVMHNFFCNLAIKHNVVMYLSQGRLLNYEEIKESLKE